jgi:hypothetical protein
MRQSSGPASFVSKLNAARLTAYLSFYLRHLLTCQLLEEEATAELAKHQGPKGSKTVRTWLEGWHASVLEKVELE